MSNGILTRKGLRSKHRQSYLIAQEMWGRKSCDDLLFMVLVMIDSFSFPVPSVQTVTNTDNTGDES